MYHKTNLMFASPKLENVFRGLVAIDEEVGGYLYVSSFPTFMHSMHRARCRKLLEGLGPVRFVTDWLIFPNVSAKPETSYQTVDWEYVREVAETNVRMRNSISDVFCHLALPFHSHPLGSANGLSHGDMYIALEHHYDFSPNRGRATTVVVSSNPLRVICYNVYYGGDKYKSPMAEHGTFHSWRESRFADWRKLADKAEGT